ncbi:MAG: hypothetical protein ACREE6_02195, partial [Limisphaerales bacterium]
GRHHWMRLQGLDYAKFKLFLMSLLWRLGVSSLDFFNEVNLGDHHEGILRTALLNDDPLDEFQYSCLFSVVTLNGKFYPDWIVPPTLAKGMNQHCYRIVINGILYSFFVSSKPLSAEFKPIVVNRNGELHIRLENAANIPFLWDFAQQMSRAINLRKRQGHVANLVT